MYDVKEFYFNKDKCWFNSKCQRYNTSQCNCGCRTYFQYFYLVNLANIPPNKQNPADLVLVAGEDIKKYNVL